MKNRTTWTQLHSNFKYKDALIKENEIQKKKDALIKEKNTLWNLYFGYDGTCLSHDILGCRECRIPATGRCYSNLEE